MKLMMLGQIAFVRCPVSTTVTLAHRTGLLKVLGIMLQVEVTLVAVERAFIADVLSPRYLVFARCLRIMVVGGSAHRLLRSMQQKVMV